ncbi:MAG: amidohydrolase family protein [Rhodospirillaceae bacterium]|nr:amidohydrolase family protein [Rhodospirillaceae bacterium]
MPLPVIDADTHVIECDDTWEFLEGNDRKYRPRAVTADDGSGTAFWLIDGHYIDREIGDESIPLDVRTLRDLSARKAMMAETGFDVQVLYPTFFIAPPTNRPEIQVALSRSYNRWMADVYARGGDAFRWVVVPPVLSLPDALAEIDVGKAHGACGVSLRGVEGDRLLSDPYFFPIYQKASDLNLPICVHVGNGSIPIRDVLYGDRAHRKLDVFFVANMPVLAAFHLLIVAGIPEMFPKLRFTFVEAGAEWVPYMLGEAVRRIETMPTEGRIADVKTALRDKRLFVTARTDNDLPRLIDWGCADNLMIGTDFGHADASTELATLRNLKARGRIDAAFYDKLVGANPKVAYGL